MKIVIKSKNIELTETIEEFINNKIGSLSKFIKLCQKNDEQEEGKSPCRFFVEIEKETMHHKNGPFFRAEALIHLPGKTLIAEARNEDLRSTIVKVKDEMQQELKKYKFKKFDFNIKKLRKIKKKNYE